MSKLVIDVVFFTQRRLQQLGILPAVLFVLSMDGTMINVHSLVWYRLIIRHIFSDFMNLSGATRYMYVHFVIDRLITCMFNVCNILFSLLDLIVPNSHGVAKYIIINISTSERRIVLAFRWTRLRTMKSFRFLDYTIF